MARKLKAKDKDADPLESVAEFDPDTIEETDVPNAQVASEPISPLGPPAPVTDPGLSSIELLLKEANRRIDQLQADLTTEREQRQELERKYFQTEALAAQAEKALTGLEQEKQKRQELERKIAVMETEMKHAQLKAETGGIFFGDYGFQFGFGCAAHRLFDQDGDDQAAEYARQAQADKPDSPACFWNADHLAKGQCPGYNAKHTDGTDRAHGAPALFGPECIGQDAERGRRQGSRSAG